MWEDLCSYGDIPPELLVSSKLTTLLDMMDAGNTDAFRHAGLEIKLSSVAIGTDAVAGVKVLVETTRIIAY